MWIILLATNMTSYFVFNLKFQSWHHSLGFLPLRSLNSKVSLAALIKSFSRKLVEAASELIKISKIDCKKTCIKF